MLQKEKKRANVGSGSYLQRGSQEPSVVLENSLENSDVPPIPVSLRPGGERGIARGLQQLGVTRQVWSNWGNLSLRPGPEYFPLYRKGETYILGFTSKCFF